MMFSPNQYKNKFKIRPKTANGNGIRYKSRPVDADLFP